MRNNRKRPGVSSRNSQRACGGYGHGPSGAQTRSVDLLTPAETARRLRVTVNLLAKWRCAGGGPRYVKFGRNVRYTAEGVGEWIELQMRTNTSQARAGEGEQTDARGEEPRPSA
jgi:hypothetical protein